MRPQKVPERIARSWELGSIGVSPSFAWWSSFFRVCCDRTEEEMCFDSDGKSCIATSLSQRQYVDQSDTKNKINCINCSMCMPSLSS